MMVAMKGTGRVEPGLDRARDRLGLAARLGVDAGEGAGGVDEAQDRQAEAAGEFHHAARLAVALGPRHAEIVLHAALGVAPLLGAEHRDRQAAEPPEPGHHRRVVGKGAVAGQRRELGDQRADVFERLRPLRVAGDQRLLPGAELGVGLAQQRLGLVAELADLVGDVDPAGVGGPAQLLDLALELGDRLLEFQEVAHRRGD
jgi:hypothetical protein